jgi:F0F1-type ATP synthase assembly protein I
LPDRSQVPLDCETVHKQAGQPVSTDQTGDDRVFDLAARRQLNRGYNDGLSRAVEIVGTPLLLGYLGYLLDGWVGIRPVMTLVLGIVGVAGVFTKLWLRYDREMREHEATAVWARGGDAPPGRGARS